MRTKAATTSTPAERIIEKFGGLTALANALGHRYPTTVQGWKERGSIPSKRQGEVLAAARRLNVPVSPADFIEVAAEPTEPAEGEAA